MPFGPNVGGYGPGPIPSGSTPSNAWVRPSDWLTLPEPSTQAFVGLSAIFNAGCNYVAFVFEGNYTVDWGDGSPPEDFVSGAKASHLYSWADIDPATETSQGYRQVIVQVTPQGAFNLTVMSLDQSADAVSAGIYSAMWLDLYLNMPNWTGPSELTTGGFAILPMLQHVHVTSVGFGNAQSMFGGLTALQAVTFDDASNITTFNRMFQGCIALRVAPDLDTSACVQANYMFQGCPSLVEVPLYDFGLCQDFSYMFQSCSSLPALPTFNTASATTLENMLDQCYLLMECPLFNTALVQSVLAMFNFCYTLVTVPALDLSSVNTAGLVCQGSGIRKFEATGLAVDVSFALQNLDRDALVEIFTNLATVGVAREIDVSGCAGYADLTPTDLAIATDKGWTVTYV